MPKSARAHSMKSRVVPKSAVARERVKYLLRMYCQMYLNSMHACKSQFCKCSQLYCHYLYSSLLCNNTDRYLRQLRTPHGGSGGIMTANIPITPPEQFYFKKPDEWLKWKHRFTQFLSTSGLDKEDEARQHTTLLPG